METVDGLRALAKAILQHAAAQGRTIATAESCTGGSLIALLTDIPGASRVVRGGWVPYDDGTKIDALGVPAALFETHGAVSREVAEALAANARTRAGADIGVSTTGILGPTGGTAAKPIGSVWIGIATANGVRAVPFRHDGDRGQNKLAFIRVALELVERELAREDGG